MKLIQEQVLEELTDATEKLNKNEIKYNDKSIIKTIKKFEYVADLYWFSPDNAIITKQYLENAKEFGIFVKALVKNADVKNVKALNVFCPAIAQELAKIKYVTSKNKAEYNERMALYSDFIKHNTIDKI